MDNPYASPAVSPSLAQSNHEVSASVIAPLAATKGWARFLGVLGFVFSGLMVLMGIGVIAMGSAMKTAGLPAWIGLLYIVMAVIYLIPSVRLNSYASRIGELLKHPSEASLVQALEAQRSFWKTIGIIVLVTIALYFVAVAVVVVIGVSKGVR